MVLFVIGVMEKKCSKCGNEIDGSYNPMVFDFVDYQKVYCYDCYKKFWLWLDKKFNEEVK